MKIHKLRLGFATNSSSSHSLVLLPPDTPDQDVADGDFGWGHFTAASPEAKKLYLGCLVRDKLAESLDAVTARLAAESLLGLKFPTVEFGCHVDHQSAFDLPADWNGKGIDHTFMQELHTWLQQPGLVILGGNDNYETLHPLDGPSFPVGFESFKDGSYHLVARKDGSNWALFSRLTGAKIRFSFVDSISSYTKASAPELVDIKITDFCPYGCAFCYQGSTHQGQHASKERLYQLAAHLEHLKVFEVALGGGEPTLHPDFFEIVRAFRYRGVVPNFTTRNLAWLYQPEARELSEQVGGFAYSTEDPYAVQKLADAVQKSGLKFKQINIHVVMGAMSQGACEHVLREAYKYDFHVTLLGYKYTGRGNLYKPREYKSWLTSSILKLRGAHVWPKLHVDTPLAAELEPQWNALGVKPLLYETKEGCFSMHLDAVKMEAYKASYIQGETSVPVNLDEANGLLTAWQKVSG